MHLPSGTRLGPYEIDAGIGAGGMGEVYRARDTRLGRTVAIKVLTEALASDPVFRDRFDREARVISRLSHPHVCGLYDVGHQPTESGGVAYLVMEYLEGETLAARLAKPASRAGLAQAEALKIAVEIGRALGAAHRLGICHRDLKPANVMLTKSGAKLLDFGLAKAADPGGGPLGDAAHAPTRTAPITAEGTILGTLQYMAPEQLEGLDADGRTDIFAFGALIYEMVTGAKAFQGGSTASLIGAILKDEPAPIPPLPTTPELDFLIRKCLAKSPDDRWQSAHDVTSQLEWIAQSRVSGTVHAAEGTRVRRTWTRLLSPAAALVSGAVLALAGVALFSPRSQSDRDIRLEIGVPDATNSLIVSLSPNGRQVAYLARPLDGTRAVLWVRALNETIARRLPGTEGAFAPFWSPDSRILAFGVDGKLKGIELPGGSPYTICDVPGGSSNYSGGSWSRDDVIVFSALTSIQRVPARGGRPTPITELDTKRGDSWHVYPSFLPDGRHFLFTVNGSNVESRGVYIGSVDSSVPTRVLDSFSQAVYANPGHLVFQKAGTLLAQPFDARRLQISGPPVRLVEAITWSTNGRSAFAVSESGTLIYGAGARRVRQLAWFDRDGVQVGQVGPPGAYFTLALSPDEKRVAVQTFDYDRGNSGLAIIELATGVLSRLTPGPYANQDPVWAPDGKSIAFSSDRRGPLDLFRRTLGTSDDSLLFESPAPKFGGDWSPDGKFFAYHNDAGGLFVLPLAGPRSPRPLVNTISGLKDEPRFSPDGRWLAYNSSESGRLEVHIAAFPEFDRQKQVSTSGGGVPWWRRDGRELYYMTNDGKVMAVSFTPGPLPETSRPKLLFQTPLTTPQLNLAEYVASRDGQRFLVSVPQPFTPPITVVLDWRTMLAEGGG